MRASGGMRRYAFLSLPLLLLPLVAAGCSKQGTVSGKVYYKGQLLTGGTVYFVPESKSGQFSSVIQRDGSYSISKLPPGKAKIGVQSGGAGIPAAIFQRMGGKNAEKGLKQAGRIGRGMSGTGDGGDQEIKKETTVLPAKFADADESGLVLDVTGGSQPYDIQIP